jgi:hypothetical protein
MEKLIEAARVYAIELRENATMDGSSYGARATEAEAERWEQLAATAEAELIALQRREHPAPHR